MNPSERNSQQRCSAPATSQAICPSLAGLRKPFGTHASDPTKSDELPQRRGSSLCTELKGESWQGARQLAARCAFSREHCTSCKSLSGPQLPSMRQHRCTHESWPATELVAGAKSGPQHPPSTLCTPVHDFRKTNCLDRRLDTFPHLARLAVVMHLFYAVMLHQRAEISAPYRRSSDVTCV